MTNTLFNIEKKLGKLVDMLLDSNDPQAQEMLDIVEDIVAFDIAYDDSQQAYEKFQIENENLKDQITKLKRSYGNAIFDIQYFA